MHAHVHDLGTELVHQAPPYTAGWNSVLPCLDHFDLFIIFMVDGIHIGDLVTWSLWNLERNLKTQRKKPLRKPNGPKTNMAMGSKG